MATPEQIIAWIDWEKNGTAHCEVLKRQLIEKFSRADIKLALEYIDKQYKRVSEAVEAYEEKHQTRIGQYGGDDSFHDMISHAVGLGDEYVDAVVADPTILNVLPFQENFYYVFPVNDDDFNQLNDEYWQHEAEGALADLGRLLTRPANLTSQDLEIVAELVTRFTFMRAGQFASATEGFDQGHTPTDQYRGYNVELYNRLANWDGNEYHYRFSNILSDLYNWKVVKTPC